MSYLELGREPDLSMIYEDESLLACNKPAGQLFHGYTRGAPSPLVDQVKDYIRVSRAKSAGIYLGVVHRLDRPVSGLSLFGRNSKATARISEQFQKRSLDKIYLALVEGRPLLSSGSLEDEIETPREEGDASRPAQLCQLSYRHLGSQGQLSLLAIKLGTGRRHQIRIQLARQGWPIVGDDTYGASSAIASAAGLDPRFRPIALHAAVLRFEHPRTFQSTILTAALPFYWAEAHDELRAASALCLADAQAGTLPPFEV